LTHKILLEKERKKRKIMGRKKMMHMNGFGDHFYEEEEHVKLSGSEEN
jgi:hypothetical protein